MEGTNVDSSGQGAALASMGALRQLREKKFRGSSEVAADEHQILTRDFSLPRVAIQSTTDVRGRENMVVDDMVGYVSIEPVAVLGFVPSVPAGGTDADSVAETKSSSSFATHLAGLADAHTSGQVHRETFSSKMCKNLLHVQKSTPHPHRIHAHQ